LTTPLVALGVHALDPAAAAVDVAENVARDLLGRSDLDVHYGLEEDGLYFSTAGAECFAAGRPETTLRFDVERI